MDETLNNLQTCKTNQPTNLFKMILNYFDNLSLGMVILQQSMKCSYNRFIGLVGTVFANGSGDVGSIPDCVIPKILKWYLISPWLTLSNIRYVSRVKWSNQGKGVVYSPIPWCRSY